MESICMKFLADLHIHSKYSRATAKNLDLEHLHTAAQQKGITVLATGDFTHPGWFQEVKDKLIPAEQGLFQLNKDLAYRSNQSVPCACHSDVRFMLAAEISNIYKKNGKTRKNHNLIFVPDLVSAQKITRRLKKIGNIESDGRPILGLDAKDLLQIVLDINDKAFLIPAHIWTPWFSLLGSKSGFDSIGECFGELAPHIFAVETGLSSDPEMNWRVSDLDGKTLVSNSDAHSPHKIGREANIFDTDLSYDDIRLALKTGDPKRFKGTFEFYPEEGKYHLDGHRKCDVRLWPEESLHINGDCPVCAKPLTLGVLHRVEALADRPAGQKPKRHHPYHKVIPLQEVLANVFGVGPASQRVQKNYNELLHQFGPEYAILHDIDPIDIQQEGLPVLAEAIRRMRSGQVVIKPGYDGEFGKINIFNTHERKHFDGQTTLFSNEMGSSKVEHGRAARQARSATFLGKSRSITDFKPVSSKAAHAPKESLNRQQRQAVEHHSGPVLIVAGPGTGKTRTLTARIASLMRDRGIKPDHILGVTFTIKAAEEMRQRLKAIMAHGAKLPMVTTFHGFCYQLLIRWGALTGCRIIDEKDQKHLMKHVMRACLKPHQASSIDFAVVYKQITVAKQNVLSADELSGPMEMMNDVHMISNAYRGYQEMMASQGLIDYEDLIYKVVCRFEAEPKLARRYQRQYQHILVDEYQDLNHGQYRLVKALSPPDKNLFVIGDPNQSIYGFRGSDSVYFERFQSDYPQAAVIELQQNYRSTQTIIDASQQFLSRENKKQSYSSAVYTNTAGGNKIGIIESPSEQAETVAVGHRIEQLVGGIGLHSIDFGKLEANEPEGIYGFSDIAVLFRTRKQIKLFANRFIDVGIPFQINDKELILDQDGIREIVSLYKLLTHYGSYKDIENLLTLSEKKPNRQTLDQFFNWTFENRYAVSSAIKSVQQVQIEGISATQRKRLAEYLRHITDSNDINLETTIDAVLQQLFDLMVKRRMIHDPFSADLLERFDALKKMAQPYGQNIGAFLGDLAMKKDADLYDSQAQSVALMTIHAAKGLEFPVVFICGCEEGLIPFRRPQDHATDLSEESRLFYVAMTRAKEQLYLSYANRRSVYGRPATAKPSPFIESIAAEFKRLHKMKSRRQEDPRGPIQLDLF